MTAPRKLTHRQRRAARLDAYGHRREVIAARVGCSVSSVRDWRRLPEYQAERERIAREMPEESATDTLRDLLHDDDAKVRLAAATALLKIPGLPDEERNEGEVILLDYRDAQEPEAQRVAADEPAF
jgi:hypothetical protein